MEKPGKTERETGWRLKNHERTANEVLSRYRHNRPFFSNVVLMFEYLAHSCMLLWNRENAVHIFFNYNSAYSEIHYHIIPPRLTDEDLAEKVRYQRCDLKSYEEVKRVANLIRGADNRFYEREVEIPRVRILNEDDRKTLASVVHNIRLEISENILSKSNPIVLIMDDADGNLGCLILYGECRKAQKSTPFYNDPFSNKAVINWSRVFSRFLEQQANITNETYLPSYRQRHSTQAAVLFGDITNFTQLSTMLRIIQARYEHGKVEQLGEILQEHCCEMSRIITEYKGRIERFIGDGLMAIFGEHQEDPIIAVGNSIAAATKMVTNFRGRREEIQNIIFGISGQNEINEMIELDYSVGINYGTVLFDYLGDKQHREYSCIGDHVAFADRLMRKAARFDADTGEKWPPILISQTAERYFKYWIGEAWKDREMERAKRVLHAKGYGYPSYVYGIDDKLFNVKKYEELMMPIWRKERIEREVIESLKRFYWEKL